MHFASMAESFWGMKMGPRPNPHPLYGHGTTSFSLYSHAHSHAPPTQNPIANIVYLPTPQNTYANVYHQQQIENYGRHYRTDILLEQYYQQHELEELYEYIRWIEKNGTDADGWNMETFFRCVEWTEDNRLMAKESYAWADLQWSQMDEANDLADMESIAQLEANCLEKDRETFSLSDTNLDLPIEEDVFQTTKYMHMDLYLEKMEELYKQKIEGEMEPELLDKLESLWNRETFGPEDGWSRLCDLA